MRSNIVRTSTRAVEKEVMPLVTEGRTLLEVFSPERFLVGISLYFIDGGLHDVSHALDASEFSPLVSDGFRPAS